jgi:hypothetical protein
LRRQHNALIRRVPQEDQTRFKRRLKKFSVDLPVPRVSAPENRPDLVYVERPSMGRLLGVLLGRFSGLEIL